jgi:hypothetical protein
LETLDKLEFHGVIPSDKKRDGSFGGSGRVVVLLALSIRAITGLDSAMMRRLVDNNSIHNSFTAVDHDYCCPVQVVWFVIIGTTSRCTTSLPPRDRSIFSFAVIIIVQ